MPIDASKRRFSDKLRAHDTLPDRLWSPGVISCLLQHAGEQSGWLVGKMRSFYELAGLVYGTKPSSARLSLWSHSCSLTISSTRPRRVIFLFWPGLALRDPILCLILFGRFLLSSLGTY